MAFISSQNPLWQKALLKATYDIYQLPGYCALEAAVLDGKPVAWAASLNGFDFIIPLVERVISKNGTTEKDLVSPYGYPGILYPENTPRNIYIEAIKLFQYESATRGYVSSFIRLHPLYNAFQVSELSNITQHHHGPTVSINLSLPISVIRKTFSQNHKRNLNRLHQEGYRIEINKWEQLPGFIELYTQTMQRKHAGKRYFFTGSYFHQLKEILPDTLLLVSVANESGTMASGGLFTLVNGLAQFHLGGTSDFFVTKSPSKLMMDAAIEACKAQGAHTLHLGGGYGSSNADGLFRFKSGFGSQFHNFSTLRFIHSPEKYNQLMQHNSNTRHAAGDYFPEYRFLKS